MAVRLPVHQSRSRGGGSAGRRGRGATSCCPGGARDARPDSAQSVDRVHPHIGRRRARAGSRRTTGAATRAAAQSLVQPLGVTRGVLVGRPGGGLLVVAGTRAWAGVGMPGLAVTCPGRRSRGCRAGRACTIFGCGRLLSTKAARRSRAPGGTVRGVRTGLSARGGRAVLLGRRR